MTSRRMFAAALAAALLAGCGEDEKAREGEAAAAKQSGPKTVRDAASVQTAEATGDVLQARVKLGTDDMCAMVAHEGMVYVGDGRHRKVIAVDPKTNEVTRRYSIPGDEACISGAVPGALLVDTKSRLVRLDLESGRVTGSARADRACGVTATDGESLWWSTDSASQEISRIDASTMKPLDRIEGVGSVSAGPCDLALAGGFLWAGNDDSTVQKIDPSSGKIVKTFETGPMPSLPKWSDDGFLIAGSWERGQVQKLDPERGVTTTYMVGGGFTAVDGATLYTASSFNGGETAEKPPPLVWRVDLTRDEVVGRVRVGPDAPPRDASEHVFPPLGGLVFADGSVWVVNTTDGTLYRLDPSRIG